MQFLQNLADMMFDRSLGDELAIGDFLVRLPLRHQLQNFELALCQLVGRITAGSRCNSGMSLVGKLGENPGGEVTSHRRFAAAEPVEQLEKAVGVQALEQI